MTEETLFHEALAKPPSERAAFLAAACAGQPTLRAAVEALLAAHEASGNPLDRPPADLAQTLDSRPNVASSGEPAATTDHPPPIAATTVIAGRYTLVQQIGEGGMGEVWVAKQTEPVKRKVALKLIKPGMDSKGVLARFEQERQALALMDHPNIAKVLDGGVTESGRPFFVMELVNGLPLNKFCDEAKLSIPERLELFTAVCQAIQHAHQKGIIHRDLKPSNILVTRIDGRPAPKVIDFGVAKATAGRLTDSSLSTQFGAVVGTLEYMSPEQAAFSGDDIDTRADIYSLGVILYELLTGLRPIEAKQLQKAGLIEMFRIIKEVEPSKPSTRLSAEESAASLAALRHTDPKKLLSLLRGELDWVVMRCLEKQRDRRYETASGLGRDIQRYLADEPVEARPPSAGYRLRKFIRRNKGRVIAAALVLLALVGGIVGTSWGMIAARQAWDAEARQRILADQARISAENEKDQKERERKRADAAKLQAQRLLALSYIDRGVNELEHGDRGQGYAFLGQAYCAASDAPDLRASTRALLGAWDFELPRVLINDDQVNAVAFSPDGTKIATASGSEFSNGKGKARLWEAATGKPLGTPMEHATVVSAVAFSPDGTKIATASADNTARLWDAATGKPLGMPMKHHGSVVAVAFSPDGTKIATASWDNTARLWDAATGKPLCPPIENNWPVSAVAFSLDGTKLATACGVVRTPAHTHGEARLWDAATGKPLGTPMKHDGLVYAVAFSPDGTKIATASYDKTARLWDAATGKPLGTPMKHDNNVVAVAFSPDGTKIVTASWDETARLWDAATAKPLGTSMKHDNAVQGVAFSSDGTKIATRSFDGTARLWDAATGKPLCAPMKHDGLLLAVAFSPDGTKIATASGYTARLRDAAAGMPLRALVNHEGAVLHLAFSPDGTRIATADDNKTVRLWDAATRKPLGLPMTHDNWVFSVVFSPDGTKIATVDSGGTTKKGEARLWDAATCKPLGAPMKHDSIVYCVMFSPDGTKIATASNDKTARLWDAATGKPQGAPMKHDDQVSTVVFSPDGTKVATASGIMARLWDAATGKPLETPMKHDGRVQAVAFSPDGTKLATASYDKTARLWDATTGKPLGAPMKHDNLVLAVAFSPDGTKIATASGITARLWDAATLKPLGTPMKHDAGVGVIVFSPDGTKIATEGGRTARLWDVTTGEPLGTPMKHDGVVTAVVFSLDGTKIATASQDKMARVWGVPRSIPNDPAWIDVYSGVVSEWRVGTDGALHPVSAGEAATAWTEIVKSPAWLEYKRAALDESQRAWHESEAAHWEAEKNPFAAAFHLKWLLDRNPQDSELRGRLDAVRKQKPGTEQQP